MKTSTLFIENNPDLQKRSWLTVHVFIQVIAMNLNIFSGDLLELEKFISGTSCLPIKNK